MAFRPSEPVTGIAALRGLIPEPVSVRVANKEMACLNGLACAFIGLPSFAVLSSREAEDAIATSPRGDVPGSVKVHGDRPPFFPDRPGKHRPDSFGNISANPGIGLLGGVTLASSDCRAAGLDMPAHDANASLYKRHRFLPAIVTCAVWPCIRFSFSLCAVEEMLLERCIDVFCEIIRRWTVKFGPRVARNLLRRQSRPGDVWHLD
ncbi:hypothetical protein [Mangrovicoccus ximenensis]|uniref:hypothetical protein n=1 Tax=Mangrovicoccus ximenensis TaxID=1911570 RepID=UPI000D353DF5|nr:hypothetical protein [Mangrovicoccus ximenensis]